MVRVCGACLYILCHNGLSTDVILQIKELIHHYGSELTIDERNLLSVAYKNVTNLLRNSWRTLDTLEKAQAMHCSSANRKIALIRGQKGRIERELADNCKDIVHLLDSQLLPAAEHGEEMVFYLKM
jgi:14-3-3 protein epsilon